MYTPIAEFDKSLLNATEAYIHRATQFLAMMGKNYLEEQPDDSNANLAFDSKASRIVGREINGSSTFSLNLNVPNWKLEIVADEKVTNSLELALKQKDEIFIWLKNEAESLGLDSEKLKYIEHYEVPEHEVDMGQPFQDLDIDHVSHWLTMRSNANFILKELNQIVGQSSDIRIWPHHFDTGTYYELGVKKAIGAGWAIADSLCDNPYLYIYGWSGSDTINYSSLPVLTIGKWIVVEEWQGAVIESTELSASDQQLEGIRSFMSTVVGFFKMQLN